VIIPQFFREIVELIAFEARKSEFVDQKSGVSARLTITAMENLVSNAERRAVITRERVLAPRMCDLPHVLPGLTGKVELVFEGEQEGSVKVGKALIAKAVRETFRRYFPDPLRKQRRVQAGRGAEQPSKDPPEYARIIEWFEGGNTVDVSDTMPLAAYQRELGRIPGLRDMVKHHLPALTGEHEVAAAMEFILDGLHQNSRIAKDEVDHRTSYKDLVGTILGVGGPAEEEEL
jgi:magnesium chelatase subunit I